MAGTWQVASGSVVGYRVNEVLAGQNNVAVGRTSDIAGHLTIRGATVTAASFTVQMATIKSDQSQRDAQFNGRIMDTSAYPTGALSLTAPIRLGALPGDGVIRTYHAAGNLTLHGRTRPVTFTLQAERTARQRHRGVRLDPGAVRQLGHRQPELRRVRDHPESRPAGVPAQVQPLLTPRAGGRHWRWRPRSRPGKPGQPLARHGS